MAFFFCVTFSGIPGDTPMIKSDMTIPDDQLIALGEKICEMLVEWYPGALDKVDSDSA